MQTKLIKHFGTVIQSSLDIYTVSESADLKL